MRKMVLVFLVACGGGDDVPSCQQAMTQYYAAGCALFDAQGNQYSALDATALCKGARSEAPSRCYDELDDLQVCLGAAETDADCDCSAEQDAILTCE
jgi:hypothetical protein